ncbi:hypothetical protein ASPZODRAFT_135324 [Penicilliopsis zonata CBS 506.65]|uniref:Alpha/beta hydrolase fold-3 domain-containing protein n=1 Tax=Penicilliopsis zonata CBS 506.65 TaxID=1073090 RepID=A0A1L9S9T2_9EURO|nr:hypothetical protein ASPZODRAFT_135324 [Penicilliopsis zonata CBS 506.65]OJJ43923.1 hypothetical protein ASPZODRAFT_135324 [Penicilliopsis zonata CBS 506.65]
MRTFAEADAPPCDWRTRQPGFILWALISLPRLLVASVFYSLIYLSASSRPRPSWTYRQALVTRVLRVAFGIMVELGFSQSISLEAGKLGDRFVLLDPAPPEAYLGPFAYKSEADDNHNKPVKPERIGATWYPAPLDKRTGEASRLDEDKSTVVLAFHSGSFLWGDGRPEESGAVATMLNESLGPNTHALWVQYRLAGGSQPTPYPAPMQDAITAYVYLVQEMGVHPSRIVLAGDSSGATIAMALVRYLAFLTEQRNHHGTDKPAAAYYELLSELPPPKACLLFSPSLEYTFEGDSHAWDAHRNADADYCSGRMAAWGTAAVAPPDLVSLDDPYLSPALYPFATPVAMFVQAGGAEVLCDSIKGFADAFRLVEGNRVEYLEVADCPHDVYLIGSIAGWKEEQKEIISAAATFVHSL